MASNQPTRADLEALAHRIALEKGVDPTLVKAVIDQESGWKPNSVSHAGARGLMQLMPGTSREVGVKDPFDPVENITGGVEYLRRQIARFGDVGLALAAYNWGPGNAAKLAHDPRSVHVPKETQDYVPGVLGRMQKFGEMAAPSAATMALFPGVKDAIGSTIASNVASRTGQAKVREIENKIGTGTIPGAPTPPVAPAGQTMLAAAPGELASPEGGAAQPPTEVATAGGEEQPLALLAPGAIKRAPSLDAYLRSTFGPLADVADPFPKGFDTQLEGLIDRA